MVSISLGPVSLPLAPLLLLLAVWIASIVAARSARRAVAGDADADAGRQRGERAGNAVIQAALLGLLAARVAFVARHARAYLDSPWSVLDLRDGGFYLSVGALAAAAWLVWRGMRSPGLVRAWLGGVAVGALLWLGASALVGRFDTPALPALTLHRFDGGERVTLPEAARGRPVVVNLWASWCGPCRQEMPVLAAAQQREADIGFLFVNQGESRGAIQAYLVDQGLPLREVLLDPASAVGRAVGSRGLPTTLFYDAQGRRVEVHMGVLNAAALQSRLQQLRDAY